MGVFAATAAASVVPTASAIATTTPDGGTLGSIITTVVPSVVASALPSGVTTTVPVTAAPIGLPISFEIAAIFAGALSGALLGVNRRFDITGVAMLALVNGLGGGILRDVLLQDQGIFALEHPYALIAAVTASVIAFFFTSIAQRIRRVTSVIDAFSLALFCLVGADKALMAGLSAIPAVLLGTTTSIGGGVVRDVMTGEIPQVMRRGTYYAVAAFAGSSVYVLGTVWLNLAKPVALLISAIVTFGLRLGSLYLGWTTPEPYDLTPVVIGKPREFAHRTWKRVRRPPGD